MTYQSQLIETMQKRLADLGYYRGEVNGLASEDLEEATTRFKVAAGFVNRPYPGPLTIAKLFGEGAPHAVAAKTLPARPPWYDELASHMGLHERDDNAELRAWLRSDGSTLGDPAQLPWCGDAMQTAIRLTLPEEPLPTNPYLAMNWLKFGRPLKQPAIGAQLVFHAGNPANISGHIGCYAGEDGASYHVLGGNQSNGITLTRISKSRLRSGGIRWPLTYPLPTEGAVQGSATGAISTSER